MLVSFRDGLGYCSVKIDDSGISFLDGMVYFTTENGIDYMIPANNLTGIVVSPY